MPSGKLRQLRKDRTLRNQPKEKRKELKNPENNLFNWKIDD
jgi:hypothetical protein